MDFPTFDTVLPCGCSLDSGRCAVHGAMMAGLQAAYRDPALFPVVGSFMDGFGRPGENIGDWSAWRDANVSAIEAGWRVAKDSSAAVRAASQAEFARRMTEPDPVPCPNCGTPDHWRASCGLAG